MSNTDATFIDLKEPEPNMIAVGVGGRRRPGRRGRRRAVGWEKDLAGKDFDVQSVTGML